VRQAFDAALRAVAPLEIEFRVGAGDAPRVVELRGEFSLTLGRRVGRMHGTLQDVTDRERATEELRKLSMAIEQAADQIVITDASGTIEYVNRAFEKMTGYSRQEAIGQNPRILKSGLQAPAFYRELWDTLARGEVFRGVFINRKKNGEIYYEEKTLTPVRNPQGEITKYIASGTDITERRLAEEEQSRLEEAVRHAAAEWRLTFDSMQSAIMVLGPDGVVRRVNHAASSLLRARPADIVGRGLDEIAHHEPWLTTRSLVDAIREHQTIPPVEIRDAAAGVTWEISLTLAGAQLGNQTLVVIRDITRTVQLQESLRRSETMSAMGALVAGVAHEARNPLFGISGTLDAFERSLNSGGNDPQRYLTVLRRELGRLNQLMHELLAYGRPLELDLSDNRLLVIADRAIHQCQSMAAEKGVILESEMTAAQPPVRCDPLKIEQVLRNLVENAVQHSDRGQRVIVRPLLEESAQLAGCQVVDHGEGFNPVDLDQVFEPFFSRRRGGTGLGLSIVQRVVEQHGGKVAVSNREEGGARVSVLLPIAKESA
jgi:PAS domain S-box-containing protein